MLRSACASRARALGGPRADDRPPSNDLPPAERTGDGSRDERAGDGSRDEPTGEASREFSLERAGGLRPGGVGRPLLPAPEATPAFEGGGGLLGCASTLGGREGFPPPGCALPLAVASGGRALLAVAGREGG